MTKSPLVLALDTAGPYCAAALLGAGEVLATRVDEMARGQAEHLMDMLDTMLRDHDVAWQDLTALGVGTGPGNFTGIRIAVSAARGLALGLGLPAVGVSLFDTTARLSGWAQTAVPAPRAQYYVFDPNKAQDPALLPSLPSGAFALSYEHTPADHIRAIAHIAAECARADTPAPKPLYIKPPDAAPAKDAPPVLLP